MIVIDEELVELWENVKEDPLGFFGRVLAIVIMFAVLDICVYLAG